MNQSPQTWQWQCSAPVRADAESMFVPCSEFPDAKPGDSIIIHGDAGSEERTGTITVTSEGDDETFFRVELDR